MHYLTHLFQLQYVSTSFLFTQIENMHFHSQVLTGKGVNLLITNIYMSIYRHTLYPSHPLLYEAPPDFVEKKKNKVFYRLVVGCFYKETPMSFQVGDEVYVRGVIRDTNYAPGSPFVVELSSRMITADADMLIPAHRVTVAPARRKAEFPKDWGKQAWFSDIGCDHWHESRLDGYSPDAREPYIESNGDRWELCEVEE